MDKLDFVVIPSWWAAEATLQPRDKMQLCRHSYWVGGEEHRKSKRMNDVNFVVTHTTGGWAAESNFSACANRVDRTNSMSTRIKHLRIGELKESAVSTHFPMKF